MEEIDALTKIGLTNSESKVYLALLRIGGYASKSNIVKESKISASKVYEILDKLRDKGLISTVERNKTHNYAAAPPKKLNEYVEQKRQQLDLEEKTINKILPKLNEQYKNVKQNIQVELYTGWKGLDTVYDSLSDRVGKSEEICILGASAGQTPQRTKRFFGKYSTKARNQNVKVRIIFNENAKKYITEMEKEYNTQFNKRFLLKKTPVEILIKKDMAIIVILTEEPLSIVIHSTETAKSFKEYFEELWSIAHT
jgi:sugar-specific transcriptional regulator TrmB